MGNDQNAGGAIGRPKGERNVAFGNWLLNIVAALALILGVVRVIIVAVKSGYAAESEPYTLMLFAVPIVAVLARNLEKLRVGKDGIEVEIRDALKATETAARATEETVKATDDKVAGLQSQLTDAQAQLEQTRSQLAATQTQLTLAQEQATAAQEHCSAQSEETQRQLRTALQQLDAANERIKDLTTATTSGVGGRGRGDSTTEQLDAIWDAAGLHMAMPVPAPKGDPEGSSVPAAPTVDDDPQKGKWGGNAVANGRRLFAGVTPLDGANGLFKVVLTAASVSEANPLTDTVEFHLHPTFRPQVQKVRPENGTAVLELIAWGAFTVGASADNGATTLELDLSAVQDAPTEFRER